MKINRGVRFSAQTFQLAAWIACQGSQRGGPILGGEEKEKCGGQKGENISPVFEFVTWLEMMVRFVSGRPNSPCLCSKTGGRGKEKNPAKAQENRDRESLFKGILS